MRLSSPHTIPRGSKVLRYHPSSQRSQAAAPHEVQVAQWAVHGLHVAPSAQSAGWGNEPDGQVVTGGLGAVWGRFGGGLGAEQEHLGVHSSAQLVVCQVEVSKEQVLTALRAGVPQDRGARIPNNAP